MIDLWIRNKYLGAIHKIGDDPHDCLMVDEEGTVHYYNLQCGDGCEGYKSVNRKTLADKYPDIDWDKRAGEYLSGYEFVPNMDEYGYPYDPTQADRVVTNEEKIEELDERLKALEQASKWDRLYSWLDNMRFDIAPDETVTDIDERHCRESQTDILDEIIEWMEKAQESEEA